MDNKGSYCILGPMQFSSSHGGPYTVKVNGRTSGFTICNSSGSSISLSGTGSRTFYIKMSTSSCKSGISSISVTAKKSGIQITQIRTSGQWRYDPPESAQPIKTINTWTVTDEKREPKTKEKTITWTNINGYLEVIKQDSKTGKKLSGVTLSIAGLGTKTTDSNGRIYFNDIASKSYTITEIATPHYGYYAEAKATARVKGSVVVVTMNNIKHVGNLRIVKRDNDNANVTLPNVTFKIKNAKGQYIIAVNTGRCCTKTSNTEVLP